MSICLCVCLFVCLFTFEVPFNGLFAPTSQTRMSNIFRDSEPLWKSNGKKGSNIWIFFYGSGLKLPRKKILFCVLVEFFRFSKKSGFEVFFVQQNIVETTLPDGRRAYPYFWHISRRFWVFAFWMIFSVFQNNRVLGYSWSTLLWHRCYYPHRSRDALSPVCGIFVFFLC